jgi:plasmid stabilization system protein ParE
MKLRAVARIVNGRRRIAASRRGRHDACEYTTLDHRSPISRTESQEDMMPRGDKSSYTNKQKRQAEHIEKGYEGRGASAKESARRAWSTVNADTGGGKKSGSGRGKAENEPSRKAGRSAASNQSSSDRSRAAKKGWEARR